MNILDVKSICFRYNRGPYVLKNISFSVKEGEIIVLLGPSGYGKKYFGTADFGISEANRR